RTNAAGQLASQADDWQIVQRGLPVVRKIAVVGAPQIARAERRQCALQTVSLLAGQPQLLARLLEPIAGGCVRVCRGIQSLSHALEACLRISPFVPKDLELLLDRRQT